MSDLVHHDVADDAFHEIQLSGKQLVFLFMATTIVAVVIFLCGVQVGRGVKIQRSMETAEPVAAATVASSSPRPAAVPTEAPPVEPPAPAKETPEDLTYAKRLQSDVAPNDKVKPQHAETAPAVKPQAPPAPAPTQQAAPPKEPSPKAASPIGGRPGVWVVQVNALKDQSAAAALAQRLSAKGYPAFVLNPSPGAPSIYRVQVGRYNDRREAEQVARRLEKEEQFKPWISH